MMQRGSIPVIFGLLLLTVSTAIGGPLSSRINALIGRTDLGNASIAVHAIDLDTGAEVAAYRANTALIPASNMKVITAGAALAVLGPEFVFRTEVRLDNSISPPPA